MKPGSPPLIAHVVHRLDYGGLENGLVNIVNRLPADDFRHALIALTSATAFADRLRRDDVEVFAIGKQPGKDLGAYGRLFSLLRRLRPSVLHTRNIGTLDCALVGRAAGVRAVVHGEHGWDVQDPDGTNRKYRRARRVIGRLVNRFVTVSPDLYAWLIDRVGIPRAKVRYICNGVDTDRFRAVTADAPTAAAGSTVTVGCVTRFEAIKDPLNLIGAFELARPRAAAAGVDLRLVMLGDGTLHAEALARLEQAGCAPFASLPGASDSVADEMRRFDIYALGSRREGISNTILEAMASGLPIVATRTGGNVELVTPGESGALVPTENSAALADAILAYALDAGLRAQHGANARRSTVERFSLDRMVAEYADLYGEIIKN